MIVGTTGSGKTTFTRELISRLRVAYPVARLYALDTKQAPSDGLSHSGMVVHTIEAPPALWEDGGSQVWQPPVNRIKSFDEWFRNILNSRVPSIIWVNELTHLVGETKNKYPVGYEMLLKTGRALYQSVITETQETAYIPRQVLGMTTHIVRFRLQNEFDARRVDRMMKRKEEDIGEEPERPHGFIYKRTDMMSSPVEFPDYKAFFGD